MNNPVLRTEVLHAHASLQKDRVMAEVTDPVRILIIDDEMSIRESLGEFFSDNNIVTTSVANAEEGLSLLERQPHDLAIVDIRLPGINGDQLIVAAHQINRTMKFIFHTGCVHFRMTPILRQIGISEEDIFLKPVFDLNQLLAHAVKLLHLEET